MLLRVLLPALSLALLAACSPEYDWRELRSDAQEYRVMLPGKPSSMTRTVSLGDGLEAEMTMEGARAADTAFTVATAVMADDAQARTAVSRMKEQMLRNIGAPPETPAQALGVPLVDGAGAALGRHPGERIEASGSGQQQGMRMVALFTARQRRVLQAVVVGRKIDAQQADTFIESLKLVPAERR